MNLAQDWKTGFGKMLKCLIGPITRCLNIPFGEIFVRQVHVEQPTLRVANQSFALISLVFFGVPYETEQFTYISLCQPIMCCMRTADQKNSADRDPLNSLNPLFHFFNRP